MKHNKILTGALAVSQKTGNENYLLCDVQNYVILNYLKEIIKKKHYKNVQSRILNIEVLFEGYKDFEES